jgi:4-hydroxybenzoate polyprenyltransferase
MDARHVLEPASMSSLPLAVDLDGTLVRTDTLFETALGAVKADPPLVFRLPFWLIRGKAHLKARLAAAHPLSVDLLPWDERVLEAVRKHPGHPKVLCTAADSTIAERIAAKAGVFDEVLASGGGVNLAGRHKAAALVQRFGKGKFLYAGNASPDLHVWREAAGCWVANASEDLVRSAAALSPVHRHWPALPAGLRIWAKALRVHQWLKNLLVFVPLAAAHQVFLADRLGLAALAFLSFGLCASAVYVLNDLLDLEADRQHPTKRHRPFAAGRLPIVSGVAAVPLLGLAAFAAAGWLGPAFLVWLLVYVALTTAYTFVVKQWAIADVMTLAALYTLRVLAGGAAVGVAVSSWLLAFSVFLFLSLALVKRYAELHEVRTRGKATAPGRGYRTDDLPILAALGGAAGYMAALVLALYVEGTGDAGLYSRQEALWGLCALVLAWISRIWLITHRGNMHDDPVVFAVRDRVSWGMAVVGLVIVGLAL